ncbi:hypothetical protein [Synoicihabitans lomoniglobus]|uniref:Uncharacterized protein n=1 Tax=Synoicihabitans lomoniglobus TaxID=2909285 RepID=A0AAF0CNH1_9BACT|nr:hypothetical protein [Opitutaceae bacterium LMO-M01]WED64415.1 hypothetical protein PXH66_18915 [Opitutaceae bacterium LMO-M01]
MSAWLRCISPLFSMLSVGIAIGLSVWVIVLKPEEAFVLLIPATLFVSAILIFENRSRGVARRAREGQQWLVRGAFLGGALVMLLGPGAKLAVISGLLDVWLVEPARQLGGVLSGAAFVVLGNFLPKLASPWRLTEEPFDWQGVHRFCGRVFMFAGTVVVWVWLAWPAEAASEAATVAFVSSAVLCVGRKFYSLATWRGSTPSS